MIYANGRKGKSKKKVRLSMDTFMGHVCFHVWEGPDANHMTITHTFMEVDKIFLNAMHDLARLDLEIRESKEPKHAPAK